MSMMDAMNMGDQAPAPAAPAGNEPSQAPQVGGAGPNATMRMGGEDPEQMQGLFNSVMGLVSSEIWEGNGADMVAERLQQENSEPAQVIGTFTGMYLMMAFAAAKSKGGMLPPIVIVAAAGQISSQLTDIALMLKTVSPDNADDTADAGALIGIEALLQNTGQQMQADELQEYQDITNAIIKASPQAQQTANEVADEAIEDVSEMASEAPPEQPDQMAQPEQPQQMGGMAAAMGGA